jgi:hypothetical protein
MAWQITYRLVRTTPLTDDERELLVRYVIRHQRADWNEVGFDLHLVKKQRKDGQVAWGQGTVQTEYDLEYPRFIQAVSELHDLIEGVELVVTDSMERLVYKGGDRHSLVIEPRSYKPSALSDPKGLTSGWDSAIALGLPPELEFSPKTRALIVCAVGKRSLPISGMRDPALTAEVVAVLVKKGRHSATFKDALLQVLTHLCSLDGASLIEGLRSYGSLSVPARKAMLAVLGNAVVSDDLMAVVAEASAQVPSDKKIAAFARA